MEIFAAVLLTWTVVGAFQWFSWVVKIEDCGDETALKIDGNWQWFWGGPIIWFLRFVCYFIQNHMT